MGGGRRPWNHRQKSNMNQVRGGMVLLVDEDSEYLEHIRRITQEMGYSVHVCNSYAEGIRQLESGAFEFIVVGQGSRFFEGRCLVERAMKINRRLPVVVVARCLDIHCYLEAMELGAVDYLERPEPNHLGWVMETQLRRRDAVGGLSTL
jgi:DNA-binding NtrC family response regulator